MSEIPPDAIALASMVATGEVSAVELTEAAIRRIEDLNPQINAVVISRFDEAMEQAKKGPGPGPFGGVPFLTKDVGCETAGEATFKGCRGLRDVGYLAKTTSFLADHFRNAGFINLGRTATPEFGSTITTEPLAHGPCRNPWNLDYSTGGSSGGSAAAVAAGIVPVAHASDGGGSIRIPASECGLVGLKPSRGRISMGPDLGEGWGGAACEFVLTRSIRDTAAVLDATSTPMPGDPYWAPPPSRPFLHEVDTDPGALRIALVPNLSDDGIHPECVAAAENAGTLLESLGHKVTLEPAAILEEEQFYDDLITVIAVATVRDVELVSEALGREAGAEDVEETNLKFLAVGRKISGVQYLAAVRGIHDYGRRMAQLWASGPYDVMVTPTLGGPPPLIGDLTDDPGGSRLDALMRFTAQFNATGQPAMSLPLHMTADHLPVGVQFVGPAAGESVLLRLGAQIEAASPWAHRLPGLFAL